MPLDLSPARALVEAQMVDRCSIFRDTQGPQDDVLNPTTLELSSPGGDVTTVATDVHCLVSQVATRNEGQQEGERQTYRRNWQVSVPLGTAPTRAGDVIQITTTGNADLLNHRVKVFEVDTSSLRTRRIMKCEDETGTLRR